MIYFNNENEREWFFVFSLNKVTPILEIMNIYVILAMLRFFCCEIIPPSFVLWNFFILLATLIESLPELLLGAGRFTFSGFRGTSSGPQAMKLSWFLNSLNNWLKLSTYI